jgi:hypothetical protein
MMARRMRRNLLDVHGQRMSLIVAKPMKAGMISGADERNQRNGRPRNIR